ncbi:MAG: translation initiation factor [Thermodesulfovibrionales bacterium]|nr:translation initiation factor [Thermodesulfovibrionales bacterium]
MLKLTMPGEKSKLVYSTEQPIPRKEKPAEKPIRTAVRPMEQQVIIRLDRKHRGGKSVTIIEGLRIPDRKKENLLKQLKTRLGTGGTIKDTSLEIQGDHCGTLMAEFEKMGYRPKRSGS